MHMGMVAVIGGIQENAVSWCLAHPRVGRTLQNNATADKRTGEQHRPLVYLSMNDA